MTPRRPAAEGEAAVVAVVKSHPAPGSAERNEGDLVGRHIVMTGRYWHLPDREVLTLTS